MLAGQVGTLFRTASMTRHFVVSLTAAEIATLYSVCSEYSALEIIIVTVCKCMIDIDIDVNINTRTYHTAETPLPQLTAFPSTK